MPDNANNRKGQRFEGRLFGSRFIRKALVELLNCFYNPTFTAKFLGPDGISTVTSPAADVQMGPTGYSVMFDFTGLTVTGSSGGGYLGDYANANGYATGTFVRVKTTTTVKGITVQAGLYAVPPGITVPANGTANQIPQYPEPASGTVYWHCIVLYC